MEKISGKEQLKAQGQEKRGGVRNFFSRRGADVFLVILLIYVILLGIGVFAEVFKVQSILHWWIWRAPGS